MSFTPARSLLVAALAAAVVSETAAASALPPCVDRAGSGARHLTARLGAMPTLADIFALNRQLAARGDAPLPHALLAYGVDLVGQRDRLVLAVDADAILPRSASNVRVVERTGGTLEEVVGGVAVVCTPSWTVYPLAGVGATSLDLAIASRGAASVDTVMAGAATGGALSSRTLFDDYGVGVDYRATAPRAAAFTAGVRVGYVERFGAARWTLAGQSIAGGPKYGLSGWYLRAGVGLGF